MSRSLPFELMDDPSELARFQGWSEEVYRDLLALQRGETSASDFDDKYLSERAILVLDLTGFTISTIQGGALRGFLRILDAQKACLPVLREFDALFVRTFADDIVALFAEPHAALDAALEIHRRIDVHAEGQPSDAAASACIGIGFGPIYAIGPNLAMGDEMNRASKLGEDTARGGETLITEGAHANLAVRADLRFEPQASDDLLFPYFRVKRSV